MNEFLQFGWSWPPRVVVGFRLWSVGCVLRLWNCPRDCSWGAAPSWLTQFYFHCGTLLGAFALLSQLDELGDEYLFSAHMAQHLILMFFVAPLWVIGTSDWLMEKIMPAALKKFAAWIT